MLEASSASVRVLVFYKMGTANGGRVTRPSQSQSTGRIDVAMNIKEPNFKGWRGKAISVLRLFLLRNPGLWIQALAF